MKRDRPGAARRYLAVLAGVGGAALAGVAAVNVVVDPFLAFRVVTIKELRGFRSETLNRTFKAEAVHRGGYDALILGDSTAVTGLSTRHPSWGGATVFNAGLPAADLLEVARVFRLALRNDRLRRALLLVTPGLFFEPTRLVTDAARSRLSVDRNPIEYHLDNLFSFYAFSRSVSVVEDWIGGRPALVDESGERVRYPPDGMGCRERLDYDYRFFSGHYAKGGYDDRLAALTEIFREARAHGLPLHVVLAPVHALHLEILAGAAGGNWIGRLRSDLAARVGGPGRGLYWDFTSYEGVVAEPCGAEAGSGEMRNYWDTVHFRREVGALVLQRVLGGSGGFGAPVTPANLAVHAARIDRARPRFVRKMRAELARMRSFADASRLGRPSRTPRRGRNDR